MPDPILLHLFWGGVVRSTAQSRLCLRKFLDWEMTPVSIFTMKYRTLLRFFCYRHFYNTEFIKINKISMINTSAGFGSNVFCLCFSSVGHHRRKAGDGTGPDWRCLPPPTGSSPRRYRSRALAGGTRRRSGTRTKAAASGAAGTGVGRRSVFMHHRHCSWRINICFL